MKRAFLVWAIVIVLVALVIWAIVDRKVVENGTEIENQVVSNGEVVKETNNTSSLIPGGATIDTLADRTSYVCDNGNVIIVQFVTAGNDAGVILDLKDGARFELPRISSVDGEKYTDGIVEFFVGSDRSSAVWTDAYKMVADCSV
jgi:Membrane-bound lysozyme-inhibitor of c-type lysozyme.